MIHLINNTHENFNHQKTNTNINGNDKSKSLIIEINSQVDSIFNQAIKQIEESISRAETAKQAERAKIAAAKNGLLTSKRIQNYGITDQSALIEIAKIAAAKAGEGTSHYIQNYGISDQNALIEIAKIAAANDGEGTSLYIQNYGIIDQNALIEIAKIAATDCFASSRYIQNYKITDQDALIKIAKIAAVKDTLVSDNIKNYGITDQKALAEIAIIAAAKSGLISYSIQNYGITDLSALIEIAKIAAANEGKGTSLNIQNYGITDQNALFEIAKIAAAKGGEGTSQYIQNYGITNQNALIEIAKIAARNSSGGAQYIQNYKITDQDALIEIAKIAASNAGGKTSKYIKNYRITDQNALAEIAKIAAANEGEGTSEYIENYGITDQKARVEIAKIAVGKGGAVSYAIDNYGITDQKALFEIGIMALYNILERADEIDSESPLLDYMSIWENNPFLKSHCSIVKNLIHSKNYNEELKEQAITLLTEGMSLQFPESVPRVEQLFKSVLDPKTLGWCFKVRRLLLFHVSESDRKMLLETGLLEEIGNYRDPAKRPILLELTKNLLKHPQAKETFLAKFDEIKESIKSKKYLKGIISLYYSFLQGQNIDDDVLNCVIRYTQNKFYYSDLTKLRQLIGALHSVFRNTRLTPDLKALLLGYLFPRQSGKEALNESYIQIQALIGLVGFSFYNRFSGLARFKDNPTRPSDLLEQEFKALVPFGVVPGFAERFNSNFISSRSQTAALTYAGVLSKLPKEENKRVLSAYGDFINWVLNETYFENRYDLTKKDSHLAAVFENRPELLNTWKQGGRISFDELTGENQKQDRLNYSFGAVLRQKVLDDSHLDQTDYPLLAEFLKNPSTKIEESVSKVEQLLIDLASIAIDNETEKSAEDKIKEASSLINQLLEINKSLDKPLPVQFKNDLEDMKKQSKSILARSSDNGLVAVDTDNPIDMLLCGTEISGSCQKVDGDPFYNRCLVAYLIDGKNRMIAIKKEDGTIVARSIIRVLLNTNTHEPVLFLERVYQGGANEKLEKGVIEYAKKRAQELNLPLVSKEIRSKDYYNSSVMSLGSCTPYEYVDSAGGAKQDGVYTLDNQNLYLLFAPAK